jgi:hypothetical protein
MTSLRKLAISIWGYESSEPLHYSQDLSMYREFRWSALGSCKTV